MGQQIRDIAHEMEDILDEYMLLLTHHHGQGLSAFLHKMSFCIRNMNARYQIASDIQGINSRIRDICDGHRRLRQQFCADEGSNSNSLGNAWRNRREDALLLDKTDLVDINESKKKLIGWLIDGGTDHRVISLLGMGGLGKTSLLKQVYDDADVKKHLPIHAWITVSQSFKLESLLKDMVQQLSRVISKPIPDGLDNMSSYQLKTIIKNWLRKRRYLIILDDLWHINECDAINFALPANDFCSRVMLTTRNADLAVSSRIESEGEVYTLEPLPTEESWTLFCRKTFRGNCCPPHLEEICKQILNKCGGLPLASVAISGVLAT
ncbi:nbs-lrr resistance protein [Hibiscus syriacus]|uniref:Nbs-lrr resistance protein n=1 Tax=Hibiscus syriacus TaxID=106335 RepID=A0A6A3CUS6_HIBSY|nr:nbs-lrr resistance protein [Hibiscus syriacus]